MRKLLLALTAFLLFTGQLLAQKVITGKVTDDKGSPIANASVVVKGTSTGTTTKADGTFSITVPSNATTLVFSSVGMDLKEVRIGTGAVVNAQLSSVVSDLSEVVVTVPYGTVKKTSFTGSENTVSTKTLQRQQVTSVTRALEGQVPGIIATNGGGAPGSGASVLIRGVGSVNASSSPLYVLNGVPYDGSISAISTDDIESVTVLKDAAAAALYGSRAANGVIMITTKKGARGRSAVNVVVRQGFMSRGIPEYDRVEEKDYYELFWEAYRNSYVFAQNQTYAQAGLNASNVLTGSSGLVYNAYNVPGNQLVDPVTGKLNPNAQLLWHDSWEDALFRTASRTNVAFNVSGATDKTDYYLSAGYLKEDGIVRFSGYDRYNVRLNLNTHANSWLTTGVNVDGAVARRDDVPSGGTSTTNPFYYTRQMGPIYPVYQRNLTTGAYVDTLGQHKFDWGTPQQMGTRPYAPNSNLRGSLDYDERSADIFNGNANAYAEVKFLRHFSLKGTIGVNYYNSKNTTYQNNQYGDAAPQNAPPATWGRSTKTYDRQISLTANQVLAWNRKFGDHSFRVIAGHENYKYHYSFVSANASGFLFPNQTDITNGIGPFTPATSNENDHRIESYFGNVNYDFNQKYLFSASYRTDGSSRFAEHARWGNFYSAGLGWRISEEKFMPKYNWLNELKLRASYGEQGNDNIGLYYPYETWYYAGTNGLEVTYTPPIRPTNADLQWETNKTFNVGVDFSLFTNRLQGTIEWFNKQSDNLLFDVPLPTSVGYRSVWQNIGSMKNYGIELQLGYTAIRSRNFNWRVDLNMTSFKNKITKLPPNQTEKGIVTGTKKLMVGHSIYDFWLPEFAGVDASNGDALYYRDILGTDGKPTGERVLTNVYSGGTNQATYYFHGSAIPDVLGGLTNSLRYKEFELSFLLTFAYGGKFYDGNYASIMHRGSAGTALHVDALNRWQKPGDVTNVPRLQNAIAGQDGASSRWLIDGSYLNIKNITLSYNVPKTVLNRLHISDVQIFANVDNAHLFSAKKGSDPQRSFTGTADATYTPFRTFTVGANFNLQ